MTHLQLFNPEEPDSNVSASWPLEIYFRRWYVVQINADKRKKPTSQKTIDRRESVVQWWTKLMSEPRQPYGPPLNDLSDELLELFYQRLQSASYRRGNLGQSRKLSPVSCYTHMRELLTVLRSTGPKCQNRFRSGVLAEAPSIYIAEPAMWPKQTWTLGEAQTIAKSIQEVDKPQRRWKISQRQYQKLAEATVGFWFYTGHRATTYNVITRNDLVEAIPGSWYLQIRAVKTGKQDRIIVHPRLLEKLKAVAVSGDDRLIPWPCAYRAVSDNHDRWQSQLPEQRRFSPQAWRRLHADQIAVVGYQAARKVTSQSLQHSNPSITESHYTAIRDAAILSLPDLFA